MLKNPRRCPLLQLRIPALLGYLGFSLMIVGARFAWADNICGENVAGNRIVDGIPAYAQCSAASGGPIYSSNGVDTATSSTGTGWVRTQGSGGYQCTELAHRYLYFRWNIKSVPNGNAGVWCDATLPSGLTKSSSPMHGDLIVFAPGSCGADATTGHVALVDVVNSNNTVTFIEQNQAGRRSCAISTAACFLHATANDGSPSDGGVPDASALDSAISETGSVVSPDARPGREASLSADAGRPDWASASGRDGATGGVGAGGMGPRAGSPGSAGVTGSGGGLSASGGAGAAGAGPVAGAGVAGSASASTSTREGTSSGGCSCGLGGARRSGCTGPIALALALSLMAARRRRPRR